MKNFKNLIKEAHLGNPLNENEYDDKWDKIARDEYGKPWMELNIAQKQEMLSYANRETEKQFKTDYTRRSQGDYSDDMEDGMTDYERQQRSRMDEDINEEFKKGDKVTYLGNPGEITFVGKDQMDRTYYSVAYDKGRGRTKASNLYNKGGEIKSVNGDKPASPSMEEDLEVDVSLYSDDSSIFSKPKEKVTINIPGDFNDNEGEIAVEKELKKQNKSFKSFKVKDIKELPEDVNLNVDNEDDNIEADKQEANSGVLELKKSLKEALNKRLGK